MVQIILDSSSDYLLEECKEKHMKIVPYSVTFGSRTYRDGIDITRNEFFDMLVREDEFPRTSQPAPGLYLDLFEEAKEAGDDVICMTLASVLSGSFQSAMIAKQMAEYDNITIIDSMTATGGIQMLANYACELRDEGKSAAEITEAVESLRSRIRLYFMVDTLEYLYRGGRLSISEAVFGKLMRIKPLLMLGEQGEIIVKDRCVGTSRALDTLVDHINEEPADDSFPFYSIYSLGIPNYEALEERLRKQGIEIDDRRQFGLTIGTHTGPGCAGVVYVAKE